ERTLFFFVQVKTTRKPLTKTDSRLRVEMAGTDVRRASLVPAPTYLVGVDEQAEQAYVLALLDGMKHDLPSIPTKFPPDRTNLPAATASELDVALRPTFRSLLRVGEFPCPACLFHFSMEGDSGHFAWVAEPDVSEAAPRLLMHDSPRCRTLDRAALDEIVARV